METKHYHLIHSYSIAAKDRNVLNAWVKEEITTPYAILLIRQNNENEEMFTQAINDPYGYVAFTEWANSLGYFR